MRRKNNREYEDREIFSPWEAYSDLYCGLLLVFILLFFFAIYQYIDAKEKNIVDTAALQEAMLEEQASVLALYKTDLDDQEAAYQKKNKELESMQSALAIMQVDIEERAILLEEQQKTITEQIEQLENQKTKLSEQKAMLDDQKMKLSDQKTLLDEQQVKLETQQTLLNKKQTEIEEQRLLLEEKNILTDNLQKQVEEQQRLLDTQAQQIEQIIGIRSNLIDELNHELTANQIQLQADKTTGSIAVKSQILFATDSNELSEEGKNFFANFMPVYLNVLFMPEYREFIAEIIIEGHTDSTGTYLHNLELSQKRALSVAEYLFDSNSNCLYAEQEQILRSLITINGCADKNLIYYENGTINEDESRRVEIKFRLKDQEMIQEMDNILN